MSVATCNHLCLRPFAKQKLYSFYVIKSLNHLLLATLWCKFILFAKNKLAIIHCIYKIKTKARKSTEVKGSVTLVTNHQLTLDNHNIMYTIYTRSYQCFVNSLNVLKTKSFCNNCIKHILLAFTLVIFNVPIC